MSTRAHSPRERRSRALVWGPLALAAAACVLWAALARAPRNEASAPPPGQSLLDQIPPDGGLVVTRWPPMRVLTNSVTLANQPAPGFVRIRIPSGGASFETALGINPSRWQGLASGPFRFSVAVLTARGEDGRGERRLLLEEQIDPAQEPGDCRWFPVNVDLDRFAGEEILLVLSVSAAKLVDPPDDLAGWAEPRLVPRHEGTGS